ncbi:hypothetical protein FEM48_Zijuj09G0115200 [Ziziphus jujuba var. spinosa]|uniref:Cell wall hydroxyproline-rich glycoprotein n=1 Tax=Ziziphus jujuba var. spinosa TaxID=714518 RepID=A0A978USR8_ZIZJJ|nr:hypothetical protein FEM48_Zijuj09G0115200 [Ziziphus jujuba var. spinosa]
MANLLSKQAFGCFLLLLLLLLISSSFFFTFSSALTDAEASFIAQRQLLTLPKDGDLPDEFEYEFDLVITFANDRLKRAYIGLQALKKAIYSDPYNFTGNWVGANVCAYKGVFCAPALDDSNISVVAGLDLNHGDIAGHLPAELALMTDVALFHLNSNRFCGIIPESFKRLKLMHEFDVSNNRLVGPFPKVVLQWPEVTYLDLRYNEFEGKLPPELFVKQFDAIFLNNNRFRSTIPVTLGNSTASVVTFANNKFNGCIPRSIGNMKNLNEIVFLNNELSGCFPSEIGLLEDVTVFDASNNGFVGTLPNSLSGLKSLEEMDISKNKLTGFVSENVCKLPKLLNFSFGHNFFSGEAQACLPSFNMDTGLDDSGNCLPGRPNQKSSKTCLPVVSKPVDCSKNCGGPSSSREPNPPKSSSPVSATAAAQTAAKSIADIQNAEDSESSKEEEGIEESATEKESEDENDKLRKSALDRLEKASGDSIFGKLLHFGHYSYPSLLLSSYHPINNGLKVLDNSVENFASGAWHTLGSAWKGGTDLVQKYVSMQLNVQTNLLEEKKKKKKRVHAEESFAYPGLKFCLVHYSGLKLEHSAVNLADSIQHGGSVAPSILETGKVFTSKGMQVLELVGKETMDLLISETGIEVEKNSKDAEQETTDDQLLEEVTFDRCFYIYGGPEQLEELEALSNHYALLFNRRKGKLSSDQKSVYDGKLKEVQQIFSVHTEMDGSGTESDKGKKKETGVDGDSDEIKNLHDSSVSKAADMAAGSSLSDVSLRGFCECDIMYQHINFVAYMDYVLKVFELERLNGKRFTSALAGLAVNDIIQRTAGRLESLHSEGVHRLSDMCCSAVSQLLILGKSVISGANKIQEDADTDLVNIDWPEDSVEKAKIIRSKAQSMTGYVEAVANSFITGISDVAEAYLAAIKAASVESNEVSQTSIQEKANAFSEHLRVDQTTAVGKIQDGLQYLCYVVVSTSMPAA